MLNEDLDAFALKAASDALGCRLHDDEVDHALAFHEGVSTEDLVDLLAAKIAEFKKSGRRRIQNDKAINELKIVLAVRARGTGYRNRHRDRG